MSWFLRTIKAWAPLALASIGLTFLVYLVFQQAGRMGANDPQIQMAEDAAARLEGGASPAEVVPADTVEISTSLAPFVVVFDPGGAVLASSAELHGAAPALPDGVLAYAQTHGEDRITWQPEPGVRMAAVVVPYPGGAVLAGRPLREVESRVDTIGSLCLLGLGGILLGSFILAGVGEMLGKKK